MPNLTESLLNEAVALADELETNELNAVIFAALLGKKLIEIKAALPHGKFTPFINERMSIKPGQCQKYMTLYRLRKDLASKAYSKQVFTIDTEIMLAKIDDDIEAEVRAIAEDESLNQVEILALIKQKEAEKRGKTESTEKPAPTASDLLKKVGKISEALKKVINTEISPLDKSEPWTNFIYKMSDTEGSIDDAIFQYGIDLEKSSDNQILNIVPTPLKMLPAPETETSNECVDEKEAA